MIEIQNMKQINKEDYRFGHYCDSQRWSSYWYQIKEILNCHPRTVLEVGVGQKVVGSYIKNNTDIKYVCIDTAEDLKPDIIGNLEKIQMAEGSFDVVCAFEVLEHLPYEKFIPCLKELIRVSER